MSKIKLLFDGQIFVSPQKTGIYRVADVLLQKFLEKKDVDLYISKSTIRGDLVNYLKSKNLYEKLKDKIISMPRLAATTKKTNLYHKLRGKIFKIIFNHNYKKKIEKFDAYFSVFHQISSIVYNSNIKTFLMIHDIIPIVFKEDSFSDSFRISFTKRMIDENPDTYFCISEYTKKDFLNFKPMAKNIPIYITYLAAGNNFYPVKETKIIKNTMKKYGIKTEKYFLGVSEITKRKNFTHLLDSFVKFLDKTKASDISLVIVGPKRPCYNEVSEKINKLIKKYPEKIIVTGYVDDKDMAPLYSGATAFIYPSLYEGFGLPILEAMKCGIPVICADNTSLPEVAGNASLYITGHNIEETSIALEKVYKDKILIQELKKKSLEQSQKFDWQKTADIMVNAMKNIIKERKRNINKNDNICF